MSRKDAFLKIEGIPGESRDDKHKEWIEVEDFLHTMTQPGTFTSGGEYNAGRVNIEPFTVIIDFERSIPLLALACCDGRRIPKMTMELCLTSGSKHCYMRYSFEQVVVSSVTHLGPNKVAHHGFDKITEGGKPKAEVKFAFGKVRWEYTPTGEKGEAKTTENTGWDRNGNVKW